MHAVVILTINTLADSVSHSLVDECDKKDSVIVPKKILSDDDYKRLQRFVVQIPTLRDWKCVGMSLGLSDSDVAKIEHDFHFKTRKCVLAMFNKWLKMDTSFSTYEEGLLKLSTTLDMVGENALAHQLKQECGK